jgi:hypothetical protein
MFCFHAKPPASFHKDKDYSKENNTPKNANGKCKHKGEDKNNKKNTNNKTIKNEDQISEFKMAKGKMWEKTFQGKSSIN